MRRALIEFPEVVYLREAKVSVFYAYGADRHLPFLVANQGAYIGFEFVHSKREPVHLSVTTNLVGEVVLMKISSFGRRFPLPPYRTYYLLHTYMAVSSRGFYD